MNGLSEAIKHQGGLTALAISLGLTKGVVFQWKVRNQVPAEWCTEIEKLTGVPCEALNDKIDWAYLRNTKPIDSITVPLTRTTKPRRVVTRRQISK